MVGMKVEYDRVVETLNLLKGRSFVGRLEINVVVITMAGVEHEIGRVGFGEVALIARVGNCRL
jgi:hypothetical protein